VSVAYNPRYFPPGTALQRAPYDMNHTCFMMHQNICNRIPIKKYFVLVLGLIDFRDLRFVSTLDDSKSDVPDRDESKSEDTRPNSNLEMSHTFDKKSKIRESNSSRINRSIAITARLAKEKEMYEQIQQTSFMQKEQARIRTATNVYRALCGNLIICLGTKLQ
jgi:hypothetical protein